MKKYLIGGGAGFVLGLLITFVVMYQMAPGLMMLEDVSSYSNFEEATAKFEASVEHHGWTMPAVHDLQKSMKKFGHDVKGVKVYELCHPDHAYKILSKNNERIVSSLMPCRVAIYQKDDGKVYVSRMNSSLMAGMMDGVIPEVMDHAAAENEEILKAILN